MRILIRVGVALVVIMTGAAAATSYFQTAQERVRLQEELARRAAVLAQDAKIWAQPALSQGPAPDLKPFIEDLRQKERLIGAAIYDAKGSAIVLTASLDRALPTPPAAVFRALETGREVDVIEPFLGRPTHVFVLPFKEARTLTGAIALFQDAGHLHDLLLRFWWDNFARALAQALVISLATLAIIRLMIRRRVVSMAEWLKSLRTGQIAAEAPRMSRADLFAPLAREAGALAQSFTEAKSQAEQEARLRERGEALWTPARLREHVRGRLEGRPLIVVANREPYMHMKTPEGVKVVMPASGLVTALEPVLRACGGTWVAHGSGDADRAACDLDGRLRVPVDDPQYTLRRVWLSPEEERGYYEGFSNEGLWPLCHIAHTRPLFKAEDWAHYRAVNEKFAEAALEEMRGRDEPCVLIQDYHFALLPALIKEKRPDARISMFWHIPWPNPETFGICPWQKELLAGLLGADLIGFHTQYHCNNFLDTVDRTLQSRIDREHFAVIRGRQTTIVKPFPISVDFAEPAGPRPGREAERERVWRELGVRGRYLAVGVDRLDYTKGIIERFRGLERALEKHPRYRGELVLAQIGAPSRVGIERYNDFMRRVEAEAERINRRFRDKAWQPIVLMSRHHSHEEIRPYYRAADVCLVTSLHDGMNLVAKEFVVARDDERGSLILSRFTGAARELRDALLINPYDIDQIADALEYALQMDEREQVQKMRRLRRAVKDNNVYRWAASLVAELAGLRLEPAKTA